MSSQQDREILAALSVILSDAATLTRRLQPQRESLGAHEKADRSPVTVADFAAQALITQRLQALEIAPLRLVGEESGGALCHAHRPVVRDGAVAALRAVSPASRCG